MARLIKRLWREFTHAFTGWLGIALAALIGVILGIGLFTFYYAGIANYFGNDPRTCASCHAMNEQYEGWLRGSHADVATCNDCHAPHDNLIHKYANKAENGFMHSLKFTLHNYPENIQIRDHNRRVTEANCLHCHENLVDQITNSSNHTGETLSSIRCHHGLRHMR